jgi:hypothetical protein
LVIKPHPRDGHKKIDRLRTEARRHFAEVVAIDDRWMFHLPFESIFVRFFPPGSAIRAVTHVVCTSSAALSLEHLYGQECAVGFGAPAVRRGFTEQWQALRLRHEADLVAAIRLIRERATANRPEPPGSPALDALGGIAGQYPVRITLQFHADAVGPDSAPASIS